MRAATGIKVSDNRQGVGPIEPLKLPHLGKVAAALFVLLATMGMVFSAKAKPHTLTAQLFTIPPGKPELPPPPTEVGPLGPEDQPGNAFFTEPFELKGGENIEVAVAVSGISNSWAYVVVDLVDDATGTFVSLDNELEYYSGYEGGESWSEGSTRKKRTISPLKGGTYVARVEAVHGMATPTSVQLTIRQNVFQAAYLLMAMGLLLILFGILALVRWRHNKQRWENSGFYGPPSEAQADDDGFFDDDGDDDE